MGDINDSEFFDADELEDELILVGPEDNSVEKFSEKKITLPVMSTYEFSCIISERVRQLDNGYKSLIEDQIKKLKIYKSYDIAMLEFKENKMPPYKIKRVLPNNTYELWTHEDFEFFPL